MHDQVISGDFKQAYDKWKNDNSGFKIGDSVWLEATNLSTDEPSLKLVSKWHGPFKIKAKLLDLTYCLKLPACCSVVTQTGMLAWWIPMPHTW